MLIAIVNCRPSRPDPQSENLKPKIVMTAFEDFEKKAITWVTEYYDLSPVQLRVGKYDLIMESELTQGFDYLKFNANFFEPYITEVRLHAKDVFVFNEWGLFLLNTDGPFDVNFEEHTFVDHQYFAKEDSALDAIYHSDLQLFVNNEMVMPGTRADVFKRYVSVKERRNHLDAGLLEIEDGIKVLVGSRNIYFRLSMPRKMNFRNSSIRIRLRLRGLLFQNIIQ